MLQYLHMGRGEGNHLSLKTELSKWLCDVADFIKLGIVDWIECRNACV